MTRPLIDAASSTPIPLLRLTQAELDGWLDTQDSSVATWVRGNAFRAAAGSVCVVPASDGSVAVALLGASGTGDGALDELWDGASAAGSLPPAQYQLERGVAHGELFALGWTLASYSFNRYRASAPSGAADLVVPPGCDAGRVHATARAVALTRDLVTTPASDMGPEELAQAAETLAGEHGATFSAIVGDELLEQNYPMVHAVGRASDRAPRLIDLRWGAESDPRVTLVGKGVCFDSGGLDLKSAAGMLLMKKDMGGAAHVLGLAQLIMERKLPVRLRVLVPAVENSVSGNAMRPSDIEPTRSGKTVEIGNTDAEGRLVLADALVEAASEEPDVILDFATLTGAARVALGTDLPALFANEDAIANGILEASDAEADPLWRMPLHAPYRPSIDSKIADLRNISDGPYGGSITAALFLQEFVEPRCPWVHIDVMAYNRAARPGRPEGGEAMGLRAVFGWLERTYA